MGFAFIDQDFVLHQQMPHPELNKTKQVEVIDGRPIESADITLIAKVGMKIQDYEEQLPMFITMLGNYPIVPGIPWLRLHDVAVHFASNTVTFGPQSCTTHCHDTPVMVQGVTEEPLEPIYPVKDVFEPQMREQRTFWGNIAMLNGSSFFRMEKKAKVIVCKASLYDINTAIQVKDLKKHHLEEIVPEQYHEFLPLFRKVIADRLPPHRQGIDPEVQLRDGETPVCGPLYARFRTELVVLKEWLEENMSKGFIQQSSSPFAAPVLLAKKCDGGLRFCIAYQDINSKTIKNRYPLPLIKETLNLLGKATVYTELDMRGAYNLLRVKEGGEHKLAFQTRYGLFEPTVMQLGMTNAPADFQGYIINATREALDDFASAY